MFLKNLFGIIDELERAPEMLLLPAKHGHAHRRSNTLCNDGM